MHDGRSEQRKNAKAFVGVYDEIEGTIIGYILDLTTAGLKLKSKKAIKTNADYEFRLELPVETAGSSNISIRVKSIWCKKCDDSKYYETGFNILDCSPSEAEKIKCLLDNELFAVDAEKFHITLSMMEP